MYSFRKREEEMIRRVNNLEKMSKEVTLTYIDTLCRPIDHLI